MWKLEATPFQVLFLYSNTLSPSHGKACFFFLIPSKPVLHVNKGICISTFFSQGNNTSGFLTSILL